MVLGIDCICLAHPKVHSFLNESSKLPHYQGAHIDSDQKILNNRMNAGVDAIADLCEQYSYSASWILNGQGPMLQPGELKGRSKPAIAIDPLPEFPLTSEGVCQMFMEILRDKDYRFAEQAEEIGRLKARIEELERHRGDNAGHAQSSDIANVG